MLEEINKLQYESLVNIMLEYINEMQYDIEFNEQDHEVIYLHIDGNQLGIKTDKLP